MSVILKPERGGRPIVLDKPILLVGRHPDCDVIIKDSPKISRKHCCIALVDHRFVVRDLDSMNGVWVNDDRVKHSHDLIDGDRLTIGDVPFAVVNMAKQKTKKPTEPGSGTESVIDPEFARDATVAILDESELPADGTPPKKSKSVHDAGPNDVVEFESAFAVPVTDSSDGDEFHPLADADD
ncbi:MAG: FHA domain-containing protein [Planctomycetota bacterium]|jgi:pSer/pThr/pTyr-binding forkhead associated (FHA) protein